MSVLRRQRLDLMTAMGLADRERAAEERRGAREADSANRWASALSSLVPAVANAGEKAYGIAEEGAVNDATAFAAQHGDVVDAQEANDLVAANKDLQPMEGGNFLDRLAAGVVNPLRAKARATAATTLQKQAAANTEQRNEQQALATRTDLMREANAARAATAAAELQRKQAADAAAAAARQEDLALKERMVKVKERPKPGPSPQALERKRKQDEKLDLEIAALKQKGVDPTELRGEFNKLPAVKDFNDVRISYEKMQQAAAEPSAAGDLALIFSFMKMLDPGSTVREGEFANAQNAGGVDDSVVNAYNRVISGERLNDAQRQDFIKQARISFTAQKRRFDAEAERYGALAKKRGADPVDVTGDTSDGFDELWGDE